FLSSGVSVIQLIYLTDQNPLRPPVAHDVAHGVERHMLVLLQLQDFYSEQWSSTQIESGRGLFSRSPADFFLSLFRGNARQVYDLQSPRLPGVDHLRRLAGFHFNPGPQDFVSSGDLINTALQRLKLQGPLQPHGARNDIDGRSSIQLV